MGRAWEKLTEKFMGNHGNFTGEGDEAKTEYLEIDTESAGARRSKVIVKPYVVEDFYDIKPSLDALREGYTIALLNIKPLKEKDMAELKRAVNKLKKTCDAIGGDIAGFGDDWIVVTPSFAQVHRTKQTEEVED